MAHLSRSLQFSSITNNFLIRQFSQVKYHRHITSIQREMRRYIFE